MWSTVAESLLFVPRVARRDFVNSVCVSYVVHDMTTRLSAILQARIQPSDNGGVVFLRFGTFCGVKKSGCVGETFDFYRVSASGSLEIFQHTDARY